MKIPSKIEQVNLKWISSSPFLSDFLFRFKYVEDNSIPTMGVGLQTKYITLFYNSEFLDELPFDQLQGVLLHEILHLLFLSKDRQEKRTHRLWNIATDICINEEILGSGSIGGDKFTLPDFACKMSDITKDGYTGCTVAEPIYEFLSQKNEEFLNKLKTVDIHDFMEDLSEEEKEYVKIKVEEMVKSAQTKDYGNMAGNLKEFIKNLCAPKRVPIQKLIRNLLYQELYGHQSTDYSYLKLNRKGLSTLPGKKYFSNKLNLVIDTSGSCYSQEVLSAFFSEIDYMAGQIENLEVIQFDTEVKKVSQYARGQWKQFELNGGGGTDIQPVFDYLNEKKKTKEPVVIFTDGEFNWALKTYGIKPLWVLTQEYNVTFGTKFVLK